MEPSFHKFYETKLLPKLEAIEQQRLIQKKRKLSGIVCIIVLIIISLIFQHPGVIGFTVVGVFIAFFVFFGGNTAERIMNDDYKTNIIQFSVGQLFKDVAYYPYKGMSNAEFSALSLFKEKSDRYDSEDLFLGKKDKTKFSFSEVHAEYKKETVDSKGRYQETWHTIFKGIMFACDFNKDFYGNTLIQQDSLKLFGSDTRVKLESPDFENEFDVYSSDEQEARYILSPKLMEKMIELKQDFKAFEIEFRNKKMYFAIPYGKDSFEVSAWRTVLNKEHIYFEINIINKLISVIDTLDLNMRIWSKE